MKKYIVIAASCIFALSSCKGFLDEAPLTAQSDEMTLSTIDGINNSVGGLYSPLAGTAWYGCDFIVCNEMKTSNGKKSLSKDSGRLVPDYTINYSATSTYSGLWSYAYYVINTASVLIDKIEANPGLGDAAVLANYKAEALFLRALSHFDLVRTFAQPYKYTADASHPGVPVILHQNLDAKPARNTVKEVYDQIISDLTAAEGLISPLYRRKGTDPAAAVSIWAIKALLSRVYLYSGQWQLAANKATEVIESGVYSMWTVDDVLSVDADGVVSVFWNDAQTDGEVIFEVFGKNANEFDGFHDGISPMTTPYGYGDAGASTDLANLYEMTDIRGQLFISEEGGTDLWTAKYYGKGDGNPDANNTIVLRLSEMYLNRAEAIANGASVAGVTITSDIEQITSNRGASLPAATIANVLLERQKELAWEGHLWFDLARTGRAMKRVDVLPGTITEVPYPNYRWAMPIPDREIIANPNLSQNEWN